MSVSDYESWAAGRERPRFTDWLREMNEPAWTAATTHRLTRELADGTLDLDAYRRYLVQDYCFLDGFVALLGHAVGHAPALPERIRLAGFLALITSDENTFFQRSFEALGVPPGDRTAPARLPVTDEIVAIMDEAGRTGGYAGIMTVLVVTEWVYMAWGTAVADRRPDAFYFREWIDLHANPGFVAFVEWLREQLDAVGPGLPPEERAVVVDLFRRTTLLEQRFFDATYEG